MKHMKLFTAVIAAFMIFTATSSAQPKEKNNWHQKMQSEMIAFITAELELTPEEAQVFWPVYNQVEAEKDAAMREVIKSYKELHKATEEGRSAKELSNLLDKHIEAQKNLRALENGIAERYKAVLPVEKVVRLYVGEEKFRRHHIRKMKSGNQEGRPEPKN